MADVQTVFGVGGLLTTIGLYTSAVPGSIKARKTGFLPYDPTPSAVALINCFMWNIYAAMVGDLWIFWGNAVGVGTNAFNTFVAIRCANDKSLARRLECLFIGGLVLVAVSVMGLVSPVFIADAAVRTQIASVMCLTICLAMFSAPLLQAAEAVRAKDASQINSVLTTTQLVNGLLWTTYGIILGNMTVIIPNAASVVLAVVNLVVKAGLSGLPAPKPAALRTPFLVDRAPVADALALDLGMQTLLAEALQLGTQVVLRSLWFPDCHLYVPRDDEGAGDVESQQNGAVCVQGGDRGTALQLVPAGRPGVEQQVHLKTADGRFLAFRHKFASDCSPSSPLKAHEVEVVARRCDEPGPEGCFLPVLAPPSEPEESLAFYCPALRVFLRLDDAAALTASTPGVAASLRGGRLWERFVLEVAPPPIVLAKSDAALSAVSTEASPSAYRPPEVV